MNKFGKKKLTQKDLVCDHLLQGRMITSNDAWSDYGITRLSAIIYNLRAEGFNIFTHERTHINRLGNPGVHAEYELIIAESQASLDLV